MGREKTSSLRSIVWAACIAMSAFTARADTPAAPPATQPAAQSAPDAPPQYTLNPKLSALVVQSNAQHAYDETAVVGGAFANRPFSDISPDGVLIGLRIGLGKFFDSRIVNQVQPIYLTPRGEELGQAFGDPNKVFEYVEARAPRGYAVGSVEIRGGGSVDAVTLRYLRYNESGLNPANEMATRRIGGPGGSPKLVGGDGEPVIGICGCLSAKQEWLGLGLIYITPPALVPGH
jgi:hypothetical protein